MCRTFRKHCCKAPHLVVSKVPGAEVRSSGQQRVLGAKAHGLQTNQEPREAEVGQWLAAPSQGRMKMSWEAEAVGEQGRSVSCAWGRVSVRIGLS